MVRDFSVRSSNEPNWRMTLDTQQLIDVAYKCFSFDDHYMWHSLTPNAIQMVLVASASALAALTIYPSIAASRAIPLIDNLACFLTDNHRLDTLVTLLTSYCKNSSKRLKRTNNTSGSVATPVSLPRVIRVLTLALKNLALQEVIPQGLECPSIILFKVLRLTSRAWDQEDLVKAREYQPALEDQLRHVLRKQSYFDQGHSSTLYDGSKTVLSSQSSGYGGVYTHCQGSSYQSAVCASPIHCCEPIHMIVAPSPDIAKGVDIVHVM